MRRLAGLIPAPTPVRAARLLTVSAECPEPPAGFEPATYALRGRRETAHRAPPAPTAHPTALRALRELGERISCPTTCPTTSRGMARYRQPVLVSQ
jgi:hypothetical protein